MSLTPYFFNRPFGSSYLDPLSSLDDFFDPFALSAPSAFGGGLTSGGGGGGVGSLQYPIHDLENMAAAPVMDVRDQGDKYQVLCKPPPNFNQNDLHVRVDRDILSVSGQHSESEERGTSKRQSRRSFTRLIRLPDTVDQQQIAAKWTNDGLSIQLPKKAGALESGRRIQIEGIESSSQPLPSSTGVSYSTTPAGSGSGSGSMHQTLSGDFRSAGGIGGGSASPMQKGSATQSGAMEAEPSK